MLEIADKVIEGIKAAREIAKRIENAELQSQMADLVMHTADLKMEMAELKSEIVTLRDENAAMKRKADLRSMMRVQENVLYLTEEVPGYNRGPFCPICFEKEDNMINVWNAAYGGWYCPNCKSSP